MADYRQIHTCIWKDAWFLELNPDHKLLFIYLFSNERTSVAGIYDLSLRIVAFETGLSMEAIKQGLDLFEQAGKVYYDDGIVWVVNLRRYNATNSIKVQERIRRDLEAIHECPLKERYIAAEGMPEGTQAQPSEINPPAPPKREGHPPGSRSSDTAVRRRLIQERGEKCEHCGRVGPVEMHHIIPVRVGGTLDDSNCILLCGRCHRAANNANERLYPIPPSQIPYLVASSEHEQEQEHDQEQETQNGAGAPPAGAASPAIPQSFAEWEELLPKYNSPALIHRMFEVLYPGRDPPDFGQIGATAKKMGKGKDGYHRLMCLLWEYATKPPQGEILPYLLIIHQGGKRANGQRGDGTGSEADDGKRLADQVARAFASGPPGGG